MTAPDGTSTSYAYNGLTTTVTDAKNHSTVSVSNILGQTLSVTPPTGPGVVYGYDEVGNLLTATRGGATIKLKYDKAGRKIAMDDPDLGMVGDLYDDLWGWTYAYNALGNMTRQEDAKDQVTCLYYDSLNRLKGKDYYTNSASCPSDPGSGYDVSHGYDSGTNGKGRRTSMGVSGGDYTSWTYDVRGRVESEAKQIPGGGQFVTTFTYNSG